MFTFLFRKHTMISESTGSKTLARPPTERFCSEKETVVVTSCTPFGEVVGFKNHLKIGVLFLNKQFPLQYKKRVKSLAKQHRLK